MLAFGVLCVGLTFICPQEPMVHKSVAEAISALESSQLTVLINDARGEVRFRATLIGRGDGTVQLLTAAHCLSPDDESRLLTLRQGENTCSGLVESVVQNPNYDAGNPRSIPGADNAFASIVLKPEKPDGCDWLKRLPLASVAANPTPGPSGSIVSVYALDQKDELHVVRAGNYSNPRWLEWGDAYRPIPGDSGSGVFIVSRIDENRYETSLVGVVTDRSMLGGGASIVFLRMRWLADAIFPEKPEGDANPARKREQDRARPEL